jgi:hypothetical protein
MVIESNKGVEKVAYLDPGIHRDSPFALGSLQNMYTDLQSLSRSGMGTNDENAPMINGNSNIKVKKSVLSSNA